MKLSAKPASHVRIGLLAALAMLAAGPVTAAPTPMSRPENQLENVFRFSPKLSPDLQRVAVMPLAAENRQADLPEGCEALSPVLLDELTRTRKFEVVSVSPEMLSLRTGRPTWTGAEKLPADFFDSLQNEYGCDAVLFCQLTVYHAYAPLAIGWRMKLVDARTRQILWAADEIFDTGQPGLAKKAWRFQQLRQGMVPAPLDEWAVLNSPQSFGRFSAATLLGTLPER